MKGLLATAFLAIAASAAAQAPIPKDAPPPPLKLRLDQIESPRPSITFGPGPAEKEPQSSLPSLGGDARRIELPARTGSPSGSPFPQDTQQQGH